MRVFLLPLLRRAVLALVLLALAGVGWAHDHRAAPRPDPALAAFLAAGGTLDDLCHVAGGDHGPAVAAGECPACLLAKTLVPSAPVALHLRLQRRAGRRVLPAARRAVAAWPRHGPAARGPPSLQA